MPTEKKFEVIISVENREKGTEQEFAAEASVFLSDLERIDALEVDVPKMSQPGSRGVIEILSAIIVWGSSAGAFKALYTVAHDLLKRYENAEVTLKFKDGSTLKITGLTQAEAERRIQDHLLKTSG
jgi:hypothetical protein